jgi:hypothetical protein
MYRPDTLNPFRQSQGLLPRTSQLNSPFDGTLAQIRVLKKCGPLMIGGRSLPLLVETARCSHASRVGGRNSVATMNAPFAVDARQRESPINVSTIQPR